MLRDPAFIYYVVSHPAHFWLYNEDPRYEKKPQENLNSSFMPDEINLYPDLSVLYAAQVPVIM